MLKLRLIRGLYRFAKKKEVIVKSFAKQTPIATYNSFNDAEVQSFVQQNKINKSKWVEMDAQQRENILGRYYEALAKEESAAKMAALLSQCTGKELAECESEARVAFKILKHHLNYPYVKIRYFQTANEKENQRRDYYQFQPFDNLLAIFDHRHPILSAVKYLGLALRSRNPLILRPSHYVLPVVSIFQQIWEANCSIPMVQVLVDANLDPKHQDSPVKNILQSSQGFVSFDGRLKDGFDFHYYMNKNSIVMRENEFLLTSSDSAYVMANLSSIQLEKAAQVVARGSFSNCGHNFNSIKRVFVDREAGEAFLALLVEESKRYKPAEEEEIAETNKGLLAPFLLNSQFQESVRKLKELKEKHSDELRLISGGQEVIVKVGDKQLKFITPAIFQVTADFPNYNYQDEEFMFPICFLSFVDSSFDCVQRINSSIFGTTASIFTSDNRFQAIQPVGKKLDVGTVNVNTWQVTDGITYSGRKRSGKGFSFSPLSFNNIVRTKSVSFSSD